MNDRAPHITFPEKRKTTSCHYGSGKANLVLKATTFFCSFILIVLWTTSVSAQTNATAKPEGANQTESAASPTEPAQPPSVRIYLVSGGFTLADEAFETPDGVWYKRGNVTTLLDRSRVKYVETRPIVEDAPKVKKTASRWHLSDADRIKKFFSKTFNRSLPLSAYGQSDLHSRWGLDHRNGMDVNLHPDSEEGKALIAFLREQEIPFMIFRGPIPRVATGPHIHIGNASSRTKVR